jgi:hypothetical protein
VFILDSGDAAEFGDHPAQSLRGVVLSRFQGFDAAGKFGKIAHVIVALMNASPERLIMRKRHARHADSGVRARAKDHRGR